MEIANSSDDRPPDLPENFKVGHAIGSGDCFFDSVAKCLKQLNPNMDITVKYLRQVCRNIAVNNTQVRNEVIEDARDNNDPRVIPPHKSINDDELWNAYLAGIEYTSDDIKSNPELYRSLTGLQYGSTLQVPIWGRSVIEGKFICKEYTVKLHVIEKHNIEGRDIWASQIVDELGSISVDEINYNEKKIIHIINRGNGHFEPVLRVPELIKCFSDGDDDDNDPIRLSEDLLRVVRGKDLEEDKVLKIKELIAQGAKVNFKDAHRGNNTSLHTAVRKGEVKIIELLLKCGAEINTSNDDGENPLSIANNLDRQDIVQVLKGAQKAPIMQSSARQQEKIYITDPEEKSNCKESKTSFQAIEAEPKKVKRTRNEGSKLEDRQIKKLKTSIIYSASGLKTSLHGTVYQLKLLMLFVKRGLDFGYSFYLATEMDAAEKFDDVVFRYTEGDKDVCRFLQAKHKQDDNIKITVSDLLTEKDENFSIQKYFISYRKVKIHPEFKNSELKDFVICTNIDLDENLKDSFEPVADQDNILKYNDRTSKYLKFNVNKFPNKEDLYKTLENTSELNRLAKRLAECVLKDKALNLRDEIFHAYHGVLGEKVINIENVERKEEHNKNQIYAKFHDSFLDGISQEVKRFRKCFFKAYLKMLKVQIDQGQFWQKMKEKKLQISQTFGKVFELDINPQLTNPKEFARAIAKAMSVAEDDIVIIKREPGKGRGIIKDNINKLAGHVLIKKDDKNTYYFSSAFFDDSKKLPGDLESFKDKLKADLEENNMKFDKDKYKFRIADFKTCEEEQLQTKASLPDDYISIDDMNEFLDILVFAVNQPNEVELGHIIEAEMGEDKDINLIDSEFVASKFQKDMLDWMKEKEGRFFSSEDGKAFFKEAKQKISKLVLVGLTLEYRAKIDDFGIVFSKEPPGLRNFLSSDKKQIFNLVSDYNTILGSIKIYQTLKMIDEYQRDDSYMFVRMGSLLRIQDRVLDAFKSKISNNLLLIEGNAAEKNINKLYAQIKEVVSKEIHPVNNKKIILITENNDSLASRFKQDFFPNGQYHEQPDEKCDLTDLTPPSQEKLLKEGKVIFQGVEVSLNILINEEAKHLINGDVLSKLINKEKIEIGNEIMDSKDKDVENYYIDRSFFRYIEIKQEIKKEFVNNTEIIKDKSETGKLKFYNIYNEQFIGPKPLSHQDIVLVSDTGKSFKDLCDKYRKHNIHWLKEENDKFRWQQSYGDLSKLRTYVKTNKKKITFCEPNKITDIIDKVIIISAEPGMGKSTVLTHLAMNTKKIDPSLWIVRRNLLDYSTELKRLTKEEIQLNKIETIKFLYRTVGFQCFQKYKKETPEKREQLIRNILGFITEKDGKIIFEGYKHKIEDISLFEIQLFNNFFNQGRVAVLFDGYDEISPGYEANVTKLLEVLKDDKVKKLWITTRPYGIINKLENKLGVFSYGLKPFDEKDQMMFLEKFWSVSLGLNELNEARFGLFADDLLERFSRLILDRHNEFLCIPLQLSMIAEVFQDMFRQFYYSDEEVLSEKCKRKLNKELNLVTLYKKIINKKFYKIRFGEKKAGTNIEDTDMESIIEEEYQKSLSNHGKLAVWAIFEEDEVKRLLSKEEIREVKKLIKHIEYGKEKLGCIDRVIDNKPRFVHRSFAEYFVVDLVSNKLKSRQIKKTWDFIINVVFIKNYHNIRRFFESKLASDDKLVKLSSNKSNKKRICELLLQQQNESSLIIATEDNLAETVNVLLKSAEGNVDSLIEIINTPSLERLPLCIAIENNNIEIIEMLLNYIEVEDTDRLIEIISPVGKSSSDFPLGLPLLLAATSGDSDMVDILLKNITCNDNIFKIFCNAFSDEMNITKLVADEQMSLSVLSKYIRRLNVRQQVAIFSDLSDLGFEDYDFIYDLNSLLCKEAFSIVCRNNYDEIVDALGQERDRRSPDLHPEWYRVQAILEEDDEEIWF